MKILVAEDHPSLRNALEALLKKNHFTVDAVDNGQDALDYLLLGQYDVAVLDIMMPRLDGFEVIQRLRKGGVQTPVLLLSAKGAVEDRVKGLDLGANDYLTKPFDIRELLARLRVLTRLGEGQGNSRVKFGETELDTEAFRITVGEKSLSLNGKEYQTMLLFMQNPNVYFSPQSIMERIWDADSNAEENTLWTIVYNLRVKLRSIESDLEIKNKRNQGYCLEKKL